MTDTYNHGKAFAKKNQRNYQIRGEILKDKFFAELVFRQGYKWRFVTLTYDGRKTTATERRANIKDYHRKMRTKFPDRVYYGIWEGGLFNPHVHLVEGTGTKATHADYDSAWSHGNTKIKMLSGNHGHDSKYINRYFQKELGNIGTKTGSVQPSRGFGNPPILKEWIDDLAENLPDGAIENFLLLPRDIPLASVLVSLMRKARPDLVKKYMSLAEFKYQDLDWHEVYDAKVPLKDQHELVQSRIKSIIATAKTNGWRK